VPGREISIRSRNDRNYRYRFINDTDSVTSSFLQSFFLRTLVSSIKFSEILRSLAKERKRERKREREREKERERERERECLDRTNNGCILTERYFLHFNEELHVILIFAIGRALFSPCDAKLHRTSKRPRGRKKERDSRVRGNPRIKAARTKLHEPINLRA